MGGMSPVDDALRRLEEALGHLEGAIDARFNGEAEISGLENELHRLGTDRSRLAQSLDAAEARSARLENANREVSRRLVTAMESIRSVLARNGN
jgi:chromosome segregation ATPase